MADQLVSIVNHYKKHVGPAERDELDYFRSQGSLEEAVSQASTARLREDKLQHQWRIAPSVLEESRRRLLDNLDALRDVQSFDDLHDAVDTIIRPIHGIGELAVYDTALRIGAYRSLVPSKVYLHAGTRKGARALGLHWRSRTLEMGALPRVLRSLSAVEAEDVLCIYKDQFRLRSDPASPAARAACHPVSKRAVAARPCTTEAAAADCG